MREIKFRAWDEDGFMFVPDKITFGTFGDKESVEVWRGDTYGTNGSAVTLMQYTGLKDKNGKEIYEGDIVKASATGGNLGIVEYTDGFFDVNFKKGTGNTNRPLKLRAHLDEVIGNIYENPELLKGSHES